MFKKNIQKKIKIKLIEKNITQRELADGLNITREYLNSIINGRIENIKIELAILNLLNIKFKDGDI